MSTDTVEKLISALNSPRVDVPISEALQLLRELSHDEIVDIVVKDTARGSIGNSANEMIRGILLDLVRSNNLESQVELRKQSEIFDTCTSVMINNRQFDVSVVSSDKTTRGREPLQFSDAKLKEEFGLDPIIGIYCRRFSKTTENGGKITEKVEIPVKVSGICFTDRVGLPMFLSSLRIDIPAEIVSQYALRDFTIPISEKSFISTEEQWEKIFELIQKLTEAQYNVNHICLRDFFLDAVKSKEVFGEIKEPEAYASLIQLPVYAKKTSRSR